MLSQTIPLMHENGTARELDYIGRTESMIAEWNEVLHVKYNLPQTKPKIGRPSSRVKPSVSDKHQRMICEMVLYSR